MSLLREFVLHASGAETVEGQSAVLDTLEFTSGYAGVDGADIRLMLSITSTVSGSAIDLKLESQLASGAFIEVGSFQQLSSPTGTSILIQNCPRNVRAHWFIRGSVSPSVTFEIVLLRMV